MGIWVMIQQGFHVVKQPNGYGTITTLQLVISDHKMTIIKRRCFYVLQYHTIFWMIEDIDITKNINIRYMINLFWCLTHLSSAWNYETQVIRSTEGNVELGLNLSQMVWFASIYIHSLYNYIKCSIPCIFDTARGSYLAVSYRTLDVWLTSDRPSTP